jgi:hypothetical protein
MSDLEIADRHFELAVRVAIEALRSLLLLNGGAATALIALTDKTHPMHDYTWAIMSFGAGALLTVIAWLFGYLSQLHYANHRFASANRDSVGAGRMIQWHGLFQRVAFGFVALSLLASILGIVAAIATARA